MRRLAGAAIVALSTGLGFAGALGEFNRGPGALCLVAPWCVVLTCVAQTRRLL